jgi:hypothetical protein
VLDRRRLGKAHRCATTLLGLVLQLRMLASAVVRISMESLVIPSPSRPKNAPADRRNSERSNDGASRSFKSVSSRFQRNSNPDHPPRPLIALPAFAKENRAIGRF